MLRTSPLLEIYRKKDIEVLILDDDIDEIVFSSIDKYGDIELKAVNKSSTSRRPEGRSRARQEPKSSSLCSRRSRPRSAIAVKDVRASVRLADSPSCIVSDEDEPSHADAADDAAQWAKRTCPSCKPTLEINPDHEIVRKLLAHSDGKYAEDAAWLLYDQALLMEGVPLQEPGAFVQRLNRVLNRSI